MERYSQQRTVSSTSAGPYVQKKSGYAIDAERLYLPGEYAPCEGTWNEFVCDLKRFLSRTWSNFSESASGVWETIAERFRHSESTLR